MVGHDQGMPSHETGGSGGGCGGKCFDMMRPSKFKRLPSNSDGRYTTSRALRRERVGPREPPAVNGCLVCASCVYPRSLLSAIAGNHVLWRWSHSEKLHPVKIDSASCFLFFVFLFFSSFLFSLNSGPVRRESKSKIETKTNEALISLWPKHVTLCFAHESEFFTSKCRTSSTLDLQQQHILHTPDTDCQLLL